ncbi:hypothetical protein I7412_20255, partial [Frankia sp. CN6]
AAGHDAPEGGLPAGAGAGGEGRDVDVAKATEPVHIDSNDEIGETAHAFSRVHSVAVRLTVEQAGLRRSLSDTLVNLARRSQTLIHQQLELIDEMERSESDGTKLASLFRIDHIATRMRRHTEDLIVLSGATPSRGWSAPLPLRDVVRGAIAEVESYSRVKAVRLPEVALVGHAVGDLLHLLAELIENGTRFSPPDAPVMITAGEVGKGYVIEIEDRGLGMTPGEMARHNERLDDPPAFDPSTSDRLGLHVVGRLAARHSIRVCLRDSVFGGVTAVVLVGRELIRPVEDVPEAEAETGGTYTYTGGTPVTDTGGIPVQGVVDGKPEAAGAGPIGGDRRRAWPPSPASRIPAEDGPTGSRPPGGVGGGPAEVVPGGLTVDGLPRRVPRKHLTAELRREPGATMGALRVATPSSEAAAPSPEEIRAMLSGYQSGFDRGRADPMGHRAADVGGQAYDRRRHQASGRQDVNHQDVNHRDGGSDAEHTVADRVLDYPTKALRRL